MVLENVLMSSQGSGGLMRPDSGRPASESRSAWHHSVDAGEQDDSIIFVHDDEEDEGSAGQGDDVVDTFERDDDEEMRLPESNVAGHIFLSPGGQLVRGNNPVVAMVEEVFSLVDVPHHVTATVSGRAAGSRRDRLAFTPAEATESGLVQSGASLGNWGLVFPGIGFVDGLHPPPGFGIPPNAPTFRFNLGNGPGSGTPVFVTGTSTNRIAPSGVSFLPSGNRAETTGSSNLSQPLPPTTLASQHPILQIPPIPSGSVSQVIIATSIGGSSGLAANNARLSRTIVTNTSTTPSVVRMNPALPTLISQQSSTTIPSLIYGHRSRAPGSSSVPIVIGNSGVRVRGPLTRLGGTIDNSGSRSHTPLLENVGATPSSSQSLDLVRDGRSGPEADSLVWNMLTSFAEDQPSSVNSALAAAIFSQAEARASGGENAPLGVGATQPNGLTNAQLSAYAGYALPASYQRWITLSRMLFGHELMDLVLISRHNVYAELARRRQQSLDSRVKELEEVAAQQAEMGASQSENMGEQSADFTAEGPLPLIVTTHSSEEPSSASNVAQPVPTESSGVTTSTDQGETPGKYTFIF
ncbi:unnamed protein product [Echinostoma caproni]|uniref:RING-type domain-containing protein n=1 Tax=Echinostoma caproni TaxID=27848 RepID=A0A183B4W5_9TREM|nr:unnamed protein product [Echinostoma caproni]